MNNGDLKFEWHDQIVGLASPLPEGNGAVNMSSRPTVNRKSQTLQTKHQAMRAKK